MAKANSDNRKTPTTRAPYDFHLENGLKQRAGVPAAYAALREAKRLASGIKRR